jgi:lipase
MKPDRTFTVPVTGGDLTVAQYGDSDGKPILAIHGITSSNRAWQWLAKSLMPRGFTIYGVDLRGRGASRNLPGPFGMKVHAADMVAVIDYLKLDRIDVIGHSTGGFVTAALLVYHPDRLARTILVDGGLPFTLPAGFTVAQIMKLVLGPAFARLAMTFNSYDSYRNYWKVQPAFVKGWSEELNEYVDYDLYGEAPELHPCTNATAVEADSYDQFAIGGAIDTVLKNLDHEILMLRAERGLQNEATPLYPEVILNQMLPSYPRLKVVTIPDTNHYDILVEQTGADKCAAIIYPVGN